MQTKINLTRCGTQIKAFSFHTKLDYWQLTVIIYLFMYEIKILNQCLNIGCWQKVSPKSHQFSLSQHPLVINALFWYQSSFSPMSALSSMNHTWMTEIKPWAKMKVKPWWHWVSLQVMGKNPGQYAHFTLLPPQFASRWFLSWLHWKQLSYTKFYGVVSTKDFIFITKDYNWRSISGCVKFG